MCVFVVLEKACMACDSQPVKLPIPGSLQSGSLSAPLFLLGGRGWGAGISVRSPFLQEWKTGNSVWPGSNAPKVRIQSAWSHSLAGSLAFNENQRR